MHKATPPRGCRGARGQQEQWAGGEDGVKDGSLLPREWLCLGGAWAQCWTAFTEVGAFHKQERECADSVTRTMPTSVRGSAPEQVPRSSHQHSPLVPPTSFTDPVKMRSEVETSGSGET